jgi:hypothetical protein
MVTDEETPLLTQGEEPTAQDPAPQESAPQEPASNEPDIGNIQPSDGE